MRSPAELDVRSGPLNDRPTTLAIAMCAHNQRREVVAALASVLDQAASKIAVSVHFVDDGSSDGTTSAVLAQFAHASVRQATGELFWGGGMRLAIGDALDHEPDLLLWLNADTCLVAGGLLALVDSWKRAKDSGPAPIVIGATVAKDGSDQITYSGLHRVGRLGLTFERVMPGDAGRTVDTMNGNVVLMSPDTYRSVGGLDPAMPHQMGDVDFGLRANALGVPLLLAPAPVGICHSNGPIGSSREPGLGRVERLRRRTGTKELRPRAWWMLTRRHGGPLWPALFLKPYLDALVRGR